MARYSYFQYKCLDFFLLSSMLLYMMYGSFHHCRLIQVGINDLLPLIYIYVSHLLSIFFIINDMNFVKKKNKKWNKFHRIRNEETWWEQWILVKIILASHIIEKKHHQQALRMWQKKKFFIGKKEANSCPREQGHELLYWPWTKTRGFNNNRVESREWNYWPATYHSMIVIVTGNFFSWLNDHLTRWTFFRYLWYMIAKKKKNWKKKKKTLPQIMVHMMMWNDENEAEKK